MLSTHKLQQPEDLKAQLEQLQAEGKKIVFTNGCFDLVHPGHIDYLERTRALGDFLVVGLNTDASVSRLKGPSRPIMNEQARARLIGALACVDAVCLFDEPTPLELITTLQPDILTKGDDYTEDNIVGAKEVKAKGGQVLTVPLVKGYSTSNIVEKIKNS